MEWVEGVHGLPTARSTPDMEDSHKMFCVILIKVLKGRACRLKLRAVTEAIAALFFVNKV